MAMNYRRLIESALDRNRDNGLTAIAVIAGLATGAAIAVLFAPKSGKQTRAALGGALEDLSGSVLDVLGLTTAEAPKDLTAAHPVDELWKRNMEHAADLLGPENKRKDPSKINVPSAGTLAWQDNQNNDKVNPAILQSPAFNN